MCSDVDMFEKGTGDKIALFFQYMAAFVAGYIIGFVYGWKLALVIVSVSPLLAIAGGFMAKVYQDWLLYVTLHLELNFV